MPLTQVQSEMTAFTAPTIQRFTSGSGTYNTPANCKYIKIRMVGGGGGGQGSQTSAGWSAAGGNGTSSTFGGIITAPGGSGGNINTANGGASPTISSPAIAIVALAGMNGFSGQTKTSLDVTSGGGGITPFGGAGSSVVGGLVGFSAIANTGSGGSGAGLLVGSTGSMGQGGGAGSYVEALIVNPSSSYSYVIGSGGAAGAGGTGGNNGGAGGTGVIIIEEYYQ